MTSSGRGATRLRAGHGLHLAEAVGPGGEVLGLAATEDPELSGPGQQLLRVLQPTGEVRRGAEGGDGPHPGIGPGDAEGQGATGAEPDDGHTVDTGLAGHLGDGRPQVVAPARHGEHALRRPTAAEVEGQDDRIDVLGDPVRHLRIGVGGLGAAAVPGGEAVAHHHPGTTGPEGGRPGQVPGEGDPVDGEVELEGGAHPAVREPFHRR